MLRSVACLAVLLAPAMARAQVGDVAGVHDPSIARDGDRFVVVGTGQGVSTRTSTDLFTWHRGPPLLPELPGWTRDYRPPANAPWAADLTFADGRWWLYYAISSFGQRRSAIGLATNVTLDPAHADYRWIDHGPVVTTTDADAWNAIDPAATTDAEGHRWLVAGSCWSGIKLFKLNDATGLLDPADPRPRSIAAHPPDNILEEGYIRRHGNDYYLWVSVGHCCRGFASDYRLMVGRSPRINGPYRDRDGKPMIDGGGTLVLASDGAQRGPGSSAIAQLGGREFLIHHFYDADHRGRPALAVRPLLWDADGWPLAGEPLVRSPIESTTRPSTLEGDWQVAVDFGPRQRITLAAGGTVRPRGTWAATSDGLSIRCSATPTEVRCALSDDGRWFAGRDRDGRQLRATRVDAP